MKKRILVVSSIVIISLLITTPLLIYSFVILSKNTIDYSEGELELTAEIQNFHINQHSELFIKCTVRNIGDDDVRVLKSPILVFNIYCQNGNRVNKTREGVIALGMPKYSNEDLIILSENETFSRIHQEYLNNYNILETGYYYFLIWFVCKDFSGHISDPFWNGTIQTEEIPFHIAYLI